MGSLELIVKEIQKWDNFILLGHVDPDGDCIGSLFALKWYLDSCNKSSLVLLAERPDEKYGFFGIEKSDYQLFADYQLTAMEGTCCIALDAGNIERLGEGKELAEKMFLINIDHHIDNPGYGQLNYVNPNKAAVGEIIYDLIKEDGTSLLNKRIATAIATAIISDTGGFRYQNTSAGIFKTMSNLMEAGIDLYEVNRAVFSNYHFSTIKLWGRALSSIKLAAEGKIAYLRIDQKALKETGAALDDSSGLVNYARDLKGVEVGISFTELEENIVKVSFRSNTDCPVHEIAAFFGGGGHPRAAGCTIEKDINQVEELVLQKVKEYV